MRVQAKRGRGDVEKERLRQASTGLRATLAANVRQLREREGLSQEELATKAGLHRTYVGSVERAERNVTLSTLEAFASAFGVDVPSLLQEGTPHV
ncbi:MAG: helix-turn-helix transcriptional regulator [Actinomycetota bacterium]